MDENVYNALFGARVKFYREKLGMTQKDLSDALGYNAHATISRIEKGLQTIPLSKLPEFCIALQVEPYDLLGLRESDQKIWTIAESLNKDKTADLQRFAEIYLKILEADK